MKSRLAALWAAAFLVAACGDTRTTEQRIIAAITEMEELAEAGERGAFMDRVHEAFAGQGGALTRDEFNRFMIMQWNQNQRLEARLFPIRVIDDWEGQASASFRALITGGRGLIPERGQVFEITTTWRLDGGEWLLYRAEWDPVALEEAF